jgi:hypothetical protein
MKPVERKYKVTQIYGSVRKAQLNRKLRDPKDLGIYSDISALHAIRECSKATGVHMDCMTASTVREKKDNA